MWSGAVARALTLSRWPSLTTTSRLSAHAGRQLSTTSAARSMSIGRIIPNVIPAAATVAPTFTQTYCASSSISPSRVPRFAAPARSLVLPGSIRAFARKSKDRKTSSTSNPSESESSSSSSSSPPPPPSSPSPSNPDIPPENPFNPKENPLDHLPDLTRGIPSTFEYEQAQARKGLTKVHDVDGEGAAIGRGRGELPDSAYISSSDRRRQAFIQRMLILSGVSLVAGVIYMGRDWDTQKEAEKHADVPNGWGFKEWWKRLQTRFGETLTYYHEPAFEKLLPDPDPLFGRPYTLVIGLEDVLVHSEWTREHGWRLAKRPGMDYFVRYLSQYFELVLFTSTQSAIADASIRKIDPYHFMLPLFREATKWKDGEMVKDLSYLNRDLSKIIVIDCNEKFVRNQPENAILLPRWTGDASDKELIALIPFLEYIFAVDSPDVRAVLKSFEGKHIPTEFARREAIARTEFSKRRTTTKGRIMGGVGSKFGMKQGHLPDGEQDPAEAFAQGKMLQDIVRERGQRTYQIIDREIRENGEKALKEEQALQEKMQKEAMSDMMSSVKGYIPFLGSSKEKTGDGASTTKA